MDMELLQQRQPSQLYSNHGLNPNIKHNPLQYPHQQQVQSHAEKTYMNSNPQPIQNRPPVAVHPLVSLHRPSRSVIHVKENSIDELDALFDPSKWSNRKTNQLPLIKRNLPQSFFRPPETGGTKTPKRLGESTAHSRQGSVDMASLQNNSIMLNQQHLLLQKKLNNLNNHHSRSASEPVSVMPPYLMKQHQQHLGFQNHPPPTSGPHHLMQQSSLPHGWQSALAPNGQQYYINHLTQETSWTLPTGPCQPAHVPSPLLTSNQNSILGNVNLSIFDNKQTNKQTNKDFNQMNSLHSSAASSPLTSASNSNYQLDQYNSAYSNNQAASSIGSVSEDEFEINSLEKFENQEDYETILNKIAMPEGWQKAQTDKGEIYFINHNTMSTQWEDPRIHLIPGYLKSQKQQQAKLQQCQNSQQLNQYPNSFQGANSNSVSPFDNNLGINSSVSSSFSSSSSINEQALSCALGNMPIDDLNSLLNPLNPNQDDIKNLILQVISKKQDLFKTLEELNKQETYLRAQLTAALEQDHSSLNLSAEEFEIITNLESTITGETTTNSGVLGDSNKSNMKGKDELAISGDANKVADLDQMNSLYNKMLINSTGTSGGQTTSAAHDGDKENSSSVNYSNTGECVDNIDGNSNANNTNNNTIIEDL